jgi:hypothetical protein
MLTVAALAATLLSVPGLRAADVPPAPSDVPGSGEPGIPPEPRRDLPDKYENTPGAHAERPGKHSTTAGRHGTSGQVGGGVNTQSGSDAAHTDDPVLDQRQDERDDAETGD